MNSVGACCNICSLALRLHLLLSVLAASLDTQVCVTPKQLFASSPFCFMIIAVRRIVHGKVIPTASSIPPLLIKASFQPAHLVKRYLRSSLSSALGLNLFSVKAAPTACIWPLATFGDQKKF